MIKILKKVPLFSKLNDAELQELKNISTLCNYAKGDIFFRKGEILKNLLILTDGIAYIYKEDKKGKEIVVGYFYRYEILAEPSTLMQENAFSSGKFKSDGALIKINLEAFETNFMSHPSISKGIIQSLLKKIKLLQRNIHLNMNLTAKEKILHFYKDNHTFSIDLKKYEIASLLGISAETYSRVVKILVEEGRLISIASGYKTR